MMGALTKVEIGDWCTLYHGDCREIDVGPFDALVTDPPYGMAYQSRHRIEAHPAIEGDDNGATMGWAVALPIRHSAYIFMRWENLQNVPMPANVISWVKNNWGTGDLKHRHGRQTEQIAFYPGPDHDFPSGRPTDLLDGVRTDNELHPTQKPVAVMRKIVSWTRGTVFDPFMGSGSTALACWMLGRKFVGVEIDRRWFDIAVDRITAKTSNGPLFDETYPMNKRQKDFDFDVS